MANVNVLQDNVSDACET